eukprot:scaffold544577_cov11-Prasinocladus_malaysianus.AAC.1
MSRSQASTQGQSCGKKDQIKAYQQASKKDVHAGVSCHNSSPSSRQQLCRSSFILVQILRYPGA